MIVLYPGSGASDFDLGTALPTSVTTTLVTNAARLLIARKCQDAARLLRDIPFEIRSSDNLFGDSFYILYAVVHLEQYEKIRGEFEKGFTSQYFKDIAETLYELGKYIRFIAVEMILEAPTAQAAPAGLTSLEIKTLVYRYIGVDQGYLADFSYKSHHDFYLELGLDIDPYEYTGTTRQRFIDILNTSRPEVQARLLDGILLRFPQGSSELRTGERVAEIRSWVQRLRGLASVSQPSLLITSTVVNQALQDAEELLKRSGATSGVDRVHTAFHGYLLLVCEGAALPFSRDAGVVELLSLIRDHHPKFATAYARDQDIRKIFRAMGSIVDSLNPIRNRASVAHPNPQLLRPPEAMLVINTTRTLLHYLDEKLASESVTMQTSEP